MELKDSGKELYIYQEEKHLNDETSKQLLYWSKYLLYVREEEWKEEQIQRADILFEMYPDIKKLYSLYVKFRDWYTISNFNTNITTLNTFFDNWLKELRTIKDDSVKALIHTMKNQKAGIMNYFLFGVTNATAESINKKINKMVEVSYGVRDLDFFYFKLQIHLT